MAEKPRVTLPGGIEYTPESWPRCLYSPEHFCGERHDKSIHPAWTDLCDCPSCPIKVAISTAAHLARAAADSDPLLLLRKINDEIQELVSEGHFSGSETLLKALSDLDHALARTS